MLNKLKSHLSLKLLVIVFVLICLFPTMTACCRFCLLPPDENGDIYSCMELKPLILAVVEYTFGAEIDFHYFQYHIKI